ncbi:BA75_00491T0 [Komagataella pastoris]|uniref:ATP synthase subunit 4 n=1 Tax=Komagataella pastoris TaxID=4922 RepID=A0A1B2J5H9_PICPA|nr:BA75_00491T0 [Komagataella pastoris]
MSLARVSFRAARQSTVGLRAFQPCAVRLQSSQVEPKAKANSIIDALPGNNILSKTGIVATSVAGAVYAISNELYVVNEESILLLTFAGTVGVVAKVLGPLYNEWASSTIQNITDILNSSRTKHVEAVKGRIDQVGNLKDIVSTTKALFELSKETAQLEAEAFALKQQVEIAAEAKSVLDSWVRYESQVRQLEQQQLASSVISKVQEQLKDPKFQQKVLLQSLDQVEQVFAKK